MARIDGVAWSRGAPRGDSHFRIERSEADRARSGDLRRDLDQRLAGARAFSEMEKAAMLDLFSRPDPHLASLVDRDFQDGVARGVVHTPTVFVNGRAFIEHVSFEEISAALDDALAGQ